MIEEYRFGLVKINGKTFYHDIIVLWTGEVLEWRRKESHLIDVEDVEKAVGFNPDTIVVGIGESGVARVTGEAKKFINKKDIKLVIDKTEEAVKAFNIVCNDPEKEKEEQNKVIGLFHLTC
jgi:hypothetical protein